jgi:hypothetical protein
LATLAATIYGEAVTLPTVGTKDRMGIAWPHYRNSIHFPLMGTPLAVLIHLTKSKTS